MHLGGGSVGLRPAAAATTRRAGRIGQLVAANPASYIAFDLLALHGKDLRSRPLVERRAILEELAESWAPPLQLSPITGDYGTAKDWMQLYRPAAIEGIVAEGAASNTNRAPGGG